FHDLPEGDGRDIGPGIAHPAPHVGIERQVHDPREELAGPRLRDGSLDQPKVVLSRVTRGSRGQEDPAVRPRDHGAASRASMEAVAQPTKAATVRSGESVSTMAGA